MQKQKIFNVKFLLTMATILAISFYLVFPASKIFASTLGSIDYTSPACVGNGQQSANQACHGYTSQPIMCGTTKCGEYYIVSGSAVCSYTRTLDPDSCDDEVTGTPAPSPAYPNNYYGSVSGSYSVSPAAIGTFSGSIYGFTIWPTSSSGTFSGAYSTDYISASGQFNGSYGAGKQVTAKGTYSITSCMSGYTVSGGSCTAQASCSASLAFSAAGQLTWNVTNAASISIPGAGSNLANPKGTANNLAPGVYTLTATGASGYGSCSAQATILSPALTVTASDAIVTTGTNPLNFQYTNTGPSKTTLHVDSTGCSAVKSGAGIVGYPVVTCTTTDLPN